MFYTQYGVYFEAQSHWIQQDSNPGPLGLESKALNSELPWFIYYLFLALNLCFFSLWWKKCAKRWQKMITSRDQCAKHSFAGWIIQHLYAKVFDDDGCFSLSRIVNESFDGGEKFKQVMIERLDHIILTYLCSSFIKRPHKTGFIMA